MAKKYEYGFKNVWYAVITEDGTSITYGTPKSFLAQGCGGISISLAPAGDEININADDIEWVGGSVNNGYDGDLVMTYVSDDFKKDVMGMTTDTNGVLWENANDTYQKFALGFEVQNDAKAKRTWYLYCSVGRPNEDHNTKEPTLSIAEKTLTLSARPRPTDNEVKAVCEDTTDTASTYATWFNAVPSRATSI